MDQDKINSILRVLEEMMDEVARNDPAILKMQRDHLLNALAQIGLGSDKQPNLEAAIRQSSKNVRFADETLKQMLLGGYLIG